MCWLNCWDRLPPCKSQWAEAPQDWGVGKVQDELDGDKGLSVATAYHQHPGL